MSKIASSRIHAQSEFQSPPFFIPGSVDPHGKTVQVMDRDGKARVLALDVALLALEAIDAARRFGDIEINTVRFQRAGGGSHA